MKLRLKWLIYPKFQFTLVWANLFCFTLMACTVGILSYFGYQELAEMGTKASLGQGHPYFKFVNFQSNMLYKYLALGFILSTLVSTIITFYVSNKLAGPLYRLRNYLNDYVLGKEMGPISFRKGDYLEDEFATLLNKALEQSERQTNKKAS